MSGLVILALRIAMVVILYAFLFWAVSTLWREVQLQSEWLAVRKVPPIQLHHEDQEEKGSIQFSRYQIILGRNPTCDCTIDDDTVSSQHARMAYKNNHWWVEDLGSTNGTFLNGRRVETPTVITTGDQIRFGQVGFSIAVGDIDGSFDGEK